jgi:hypothetical protein
MTETPQEAYDRGDAAGRIAQRLDGYDQHFRIINGSIEKSAVAIHELAMEVQRLADQAVADAKEREKTAAALEKSRRETAEAVESERAARADRAATAWTPLARGMTLLAALATLLGIIGWFKGH